MSRLNDVARLAGAAVNSRARARIGILVFSLLIGACSDSPSSSVARADKYIAAGKDKEAVLELKNALSSQPDHPEANFVLGRLLLKVGNLADARHALERARKSGHPSTDVVPVLAEALIESERYTDAIELLKSEITDDEAYQARLAVLRGSAFLGNGAALDARTQYQLALKTRPVDARLGLARLATLSNDGAGAKQELDTAASIDGETAKILLARADMLQAQGKSREAVEFYKKAAAAEPNNVTALASAAILVLNSGNKEEGKQLFERAEKISPLKPIVEFARALLAHKEDRTQDALASLAQLFEAVPTHGPGLLLAGALNYATGQFELARNAYGAYLGRDPNSTLARRMLAATMLQLGRPASALRTLGPSLDKIQDPEILAIGGGAYLAMGRFAKATQLLERAVENGKNSADLHVSLGRAYLAGGNRKGAIAQFERAIALKPSHARADHALAMTYLADKKIDMAKRVVDDLFQRVPNSADGHTLRGAVQLVQGDTTAARRSFESALAVDAAYVPAAEALADLDQRQGDAEAFRKRMESVLAKDPKQLNALLALAKWDAVRGRSEQAMGRAREALTAHPNSLNALLLLTEIQIKLGKAAEAIATARRAADEHPWDSRPVGLLADAQLASGDLAGATVTLTKLVEMRPGQMEPELRLAAVMADSGDLRGATGRLQRLQRVHTRRPEPAALMGRIYLHQKRIDDARAVLKMLVSSHARSFERHKLEGDIAGASGDPSAAASAYRAADRVRPSGELRVLAHRAEVQLNGPAASTAGLVEWLQAHPADSEVRLYLGDALSGAGKYEAARQQYEALLQADPNDFRILNNLAWVLAQLKDSRALDYAQRAVKLAPDDALVLDTLGYTLLGLGRASDALQTLLLASKKAPEHLAIRHHLVLALEQAGDAARAKEEFKTLIDLARRQGKTEILRQMIEARAGR